MGIILLVVVPLAFWIYAELKLGRIARIVAGLMLVGAAVAITNFFVTYIPRHEAFLHRGSMLVVNELILTGNVQRVTDALGVYNKIAATGSTYEAALRMSSVLDHGTNVFHDTPNKIGGANLK